MTQVRCRHKHLSRHPIHRPTVPATEHPCRAVRASIEERERPTVARLTVWIGGRVRNRERRRLRQRSSGRMSVCIGRRSGGGIGWRPRKTIGQLASSRLQESGPNRMAVRLSHRRTKLLVGEASASLLLTLICRARRATAPHNGALRGATYFAGSVVFRATGCQWRPSSVEVQKAPSADPAYAVLPSRL